MVALLCCPRGGSVDWDGGRTEGASANGSHEPPPAASAATRRRRGGVRGACPLLT